MYPQIEVMAGARGWRFSLDAARTTIGKGVIAALEGDLGRPVVTANQALLWAALMAAGGDSGAVEDYGRLFDQR